MEDKLKNRIYLYHHFRVTIFSDVSKQYYVNLDHQRLPGERHQQRHNPRDGRVIS